MHAVSLTCHPSTPCSYVRAVSVRVDRLSEDLLVLYYRLEGDIDRLRLPAQRRSAHTDGLWRHTCFEAFIRAGVAQPYLELNFSPSSEWAVYRFDDYRHGMTPVEPQHAPKVICRRRADTLEADVDVHLSGLLGPQLHAPANGLRLALAVVLEDLQGQLSYWALAHAPDRADFHHDDSFALWLPPPGDVA